MIMNRRNFIKIAGLSVAGLAAAQTNPIPSKKLNILLYVVDDQGTNDAGCYGHKTIKTPGLDMLAENGTRFTNAFCAASSCSPSRATILTGLHCHTHGQYGLEHGVHHFSSFGRIKSLPLLLQQAGYRTATAGKYHLAPQSVYPFRQTLPGGSPVEMAEQCRTLFAEKTESPFFLYFCTHEPHRPFSREGSDKVDPEDVAIPSFLNDTPAAREELAQYYMSIQRADRGLVRLIELLKETGQWEETLIVYLSDNGAAFPGAKTNLYDPGVKLPCVIRSPNQQKPGNVCSAMISWTDITPTILDAASVTPENCSFHGRSIKPILDQEDAPERDCIYASQCFHEITMYYPMRAVRTRRYKLIYNIAHPLAFPIANDIWQSGTWQSILRQKEDRLGKRTLDAYLNRPGFELYDLKNDPEELVNLAGDPEYNDILEQLKRKIAAFQKETEDPWFAIQQRKTAFNSDAARQPNARYQSHL
jgi:N-sulfoglucosamine sulfohydrolase